MQFLQEYHFGWLDLQNGSVRWNGSSLFFPLEDIRHIIIIECLGERAGQLYPPVSSR